MDFMQAMAWAEENSDIAKKWFNKYGYLTPYGVDDFQQVVLEAALTASTVLGDKPHKSYEAIFVRTLQVGMSTLIPGYGFSEGRKSGANANISMSIPSSRCVSYEHECFSIDIPDEDTELSFYDIDCCNKEEFVNPAYNAEHAFHLVQDHLNERQKIVLTNTLGLSEKGCMSAREIEKESGISKSTVSRELGNILNLVIDLVGKGVIAVFSPLPRRPTLEFDIRVSSSDASISVSALDNQSALMTIGSAFWAGFRWNNMASDEYVLEVETRRSVFESGMDAVNALVMRLGSDRFSGDDLVALAGSKRFYSKNSTFIRSVYRGSGATGKSSISQLFADSTDTHPPIFFKRGQAIDFGRSPGTAAYGDSALHGRSFLNNRSSGCSVSRGDPFRYCVCRADNYLSENKMFGVG